jgi:hypothetical protein
MSKSLATEFVANSSELLDQSMIKIFHCVEQLSENQVWWRPYPNANSIGNLCLHISGNLRQWGIVPLTGDKDRRERASEFSDNVKLSKDELIGDLESVMAEAKQAWSPLNEERLMREHRIQGFQVTVAHAILHTSSHFAGHTHQIITLTRIQLGDAYRFQWTPDSDRDNLPI